MWSLSICKTQSTVRKANSSALHACNIRNSTGPEIFFLTNPPDDSGTSQVALVVKNPPANTGHARDAGLIPGSGRAPRVGSSNPLQYSYLENPMDREAWWAIHGVAESGTTECTYTHTAPQMILMHEKGGSHWSRTAFIPQGFF